MKYELDINVTRTYTIEVEANSEDDAIEKGWQMYELLQDNNTLVDYFSDERVEVGI